MHSAPLTAVAMAVLLGVVGQVLGSLTRMPAIVFLLLLGMAAGPFGVGLFDPTDFGSAIPVLTSAFVAIILFEGALTLRPALIREALLPVRRLITVGAGLTLAGAAVLSHYLVDLPWPLAFVYASLVVVTGPTVITPILRRVRLLPRLHAVIKSESILIDPVGVFIAIVTLQYVVDLVGQEASWREALQGFFERVGFGALVGGVVGLTAAAVARFRLFHRAENEHLVNLGALGLSLGAFAVAEMFQSESGIMAVIVAGLLLAAFPIPFREELEKFKENVTTLGVSVLFILLAANLNWSLIQEAGWGEAALLAGLIFLVRPISVFLSTIGTGLNWREKAYLSMIAPRGILAAAMASYFAVQLREHGLAGANRVEMLVFFTIGTTVFIQGSWAGLLARLLRVQPVQPEGVLLVGVNELSLTLAGELREWGRHVQFVDNNPVSCELARGHGFPAHEGDATAAETYQDLDFSTIGMLIAMTPNDAINTLACDAAGEWLETDALYQVVSEPTGAAVPSKVRMAGRWALPTRFSQRELLQLLARKQLRLEIELCRRPVRITPELPTCKGRMIPLVVMEFGRLSIAHNGQACSKSALIIGLVGAEREELAEQPDLGDPARGSEAAPAGSGS